MQTAARLQSSRIVMGLSPKLTPSEQGAQVGGIGSNCPSRGPRSRSRSCWRTRRTAVFFNLGPHPPRLWPEDIDLAHRLWLELSAMGPGSKLHHRDIIGVALRRMRRGTALATVREKWSATCCARSPAPTDTDRPSPDTEPGDSAVACPPRAEIPYDL